MIRLAWVGIFGAAVVGLVFSVYVSRTQYYDRIIEIGGEKFTLHVADNVYERQKGLQGLEKLDPNEGMLFLFEREGEYIFWMKDVSFSLDILWMRDTEVVDITTRTEAFIAGVSDDTLPRYRSQAPVNAVIELLGGTVDRLQIRIGDRIGVP